MRGNLEDPTTILKDPATILEDPATIFEDFAAIRVEDPANILIISLLRSPRILVQDLVQDRLKDVTGSLVGCYQT